MVAAPGWSGNGNGGDPAAVDNRTLDRAGRCSTCQWPSCRWCRRLGSVATLRTSTYLAPIAEPPRRPPAPPRAAPLHPASIAYTPALADPAPSSRHAPPCRPAQIADPAPPCRHAPPSRLAPRRRGHRAIDRTVPSGRGEPQAVRESMARNQLWRYAQGLEYMCGFRPTPIDSGASPGPCVLDAGGGLC